MKAGVYRSRREDVDGRMEGNMIKRNSAGAAGRFAGCTLILAALLFTGCGQPEEEKPIVVVEQPEEVTSYELVTATVGDIIRTEQVRSTYRQLQDQEVSFAVSGKVVRKVYVYEGDAVKKGDLLAELSGGSLDQDIERLEYDIARNELLLSYTDKNESIEISALWVNYLDYSAQSENDRKNLNNSIEALQRNYRYRREDLMDTLELDRMELELLKQEVSQSRVYANMNGIVHNMKERLEGSTSAKDEVVMTIIDNSRCIFVANAPEYAEFFHEGESIHMQLVAAGAKEYEVLPWNMDEWGETQTFIVADDIDSSALEVGVTGIMDVVVSRRTQVLTIPPRAVKQAGERTYVYVLNDDGMREVKWIETGVYGSDAVEVLSGLEEGDKVIVR